MAISTGEHTGLTYPSLYFTKYCWKTAALGQVPKEGQACSSLDKSAKIHRELMCRVRRCHLYNPSTSPKPKYIFYEEKGSASCRRPADPSV